MSCDRKCYDLAEVFADDSEIIGSRSTREREEAVHRIAHAIQGAIEGEIESIERKIYESKDPTPEELANAPF